MKINHANIFEEKKRVKNKLAIASIESLQYCFCAHVELL